MTRTTPKTGTRKLRSLLLILALGLSCSSDGSANHLSRPAFNPGSAATLRVGTYNIYFRTRDLTETNAVLRKMDADVVALQEVAKECGPMFDKELCREYPYRYFSSGLGLLSRFPLLNPHFEHSRRGINGFLFAEIDHPQRGRVQIVNLHLDPLHLWTARDLSMLPFQFRRQRGIQQDELRQAFAHLKPGVPTILTGDFNRVGNDAVNKLREMGFIDSYAAVTKDRDRVSTLHFSLLGIRCGRRIDYVFHDHNFQTFQSAVHPGRPSDHDALTSGLVWNTRGAR